MPSTSAVSSYCGTYNDGRTATRRQVTVLPQADGLTIVDDRGRVIAFWSYQELHTLDERGDDRVVRLRHGDDEARLTIVDPGILRELAHLAPTLRAKDHAAAAVLGWGLLGLAVTALLVGLLWIEMPGLTRFAASKIPVAWEETLGERVRDDVARFFADSDDPDTLYCAGTEGRAVLDRLTARLAAAAEAPYTFRVRILSTEQVNAVALPGGWIILMSGLIESAESAEEVAGVLAHEIGHVVHRHGTQSVIRGLGFELLFGLLMGDMGEGIFGSAAQIFLRISYGRDDEAEADQSALALLAAADIDPRGLAQFFQRLAQDAPDAPAALQLFSTHPSSDRRAKLFSEAEPGGPAMSAEDWQKLRDICA